MATLRSAAGNIDCCKFLHYQTRFAKRKPARSPTTVKPLKDQYFRNIAEYWGVVNGMVRVGTDIGGIEGLRTIQIEAANMTAILLQSQLLSTVRNVRHGFGTRQAGLWTDNLPAARLKQIHSDVVLKAEGACEALGEGDAVICGTPGIWIGVKTADCVPVLLADRRRNVVAAVHAGWRGTAAEIVRKTLLRMEAEFGTVAEDVVAAVGPCIGGCCYEVGDDVAAHFQRIGQTERGRARIDLAGENAGQLAAAGVKEIEQMGLCTRCDGDRFHSFRRDAALAGRMVSAILLEE